MKYKIALEHTDEGYSATVPGLPGCWSEGSTEKDAIDNIRIAISEHLSVRDELLAGSVRDTGLSIDDFRQLL